MLCATIWKKKNHGGPYLFISYYDQQCTIITQSNEPLHVSKLSVILRELVINTFPSYTSISNAAVGNTIYN